MYTRKEQARMELDFETHICFCTFDCDRSIKGYGVGDTKIKCAIPYRRVHRLFRTVRQT